MLRKGLFKEIMFEFWGLNDEKAHKGTSVSATWTAGPDVLRPEGGRAVCESIVSKGKQADTEWESWAKAKSCGSPEWMWSVVAERICRDLQLSSVWKPGRRGGGIVTRMETRPVPRRLRWCSRSTSVEWSGWICDVVWRQTPGWAGCLDEGKLSSWHLCWAWWVVWVPFKSWSSSCHPFSLPLPPNFSREESTLAISACSPSSPPLTPADQPRLLPWTEIAAPGLLTTSHDPHFVFVQQHLTLLRSFFPFLNLYSLGFHDISIVQTFSQALCFVGPSSSALLACEVCSLALSSSPCTATLLSSTIMALSAISSWKQWILHLQPWSFFRITSRLCVQLSVGPTLNTCQTEILSSHLLLPPLIHPQLSYIERLPCSASSWHGDFLCIQHPLTPVPQPGSLLLVLNTQYRGSHPLGIFPTLSAWLWVLPNRAVPTAPHTHLDGGLATLFNSLLASLSPWVVISSAIQGTVCLTSLSLHKFHTDPGHRIKSMDFPRADISRSSLLFLIFPFALSLFMSSLLPGDFLLPSASCLSHMLIP